MINWSNTPPPQHRGHSYPLIRVSPQGQLKALIISHDLLGTPTHFYAGRTQPCRGDTCEACTNGNPYRWHGYVGVRIINSGLLAILELTAAACEVLTEYRRIHGTLRGAELSAYRLNGSKNGQVCSTIRPCDIDPRFINAEPDLPMIMARIWNLPLWEIPTIAPKLELQNESPRPGAETEIPPQ